MGGVKIILRIYTILLNLLSLSEMWLNFKKKYQKIKNKLLQQPLVCHCLFKTLTIKVQSVHRNPSIRYIKELLFLTVCNESTSLLQLLKEEQYSSVSFKIKNMSRNRKYWVFLLLGVDLIWSQFLCLDVLLFIGPLSESESSVFW